MGEIYAGQLDLRHQLSSYEEPNTSSFGKFWNHVKVKNERRCIPSVAAKVLGALVLLLSGQFKGGSIDALPTIKQIILFTFWSGNMGLLDEFDDLEEDMKTSTSRKFEKLSYVGFMLPIPFLMVMNPPLYVSFALYKLIAHSLAGKIDSKYFQWTAALGLCCTVLVARATKVAFPILGIALVSISNSVYQIHDEHPMLIGLTRKHPIMNKLWDALSMHSCMVILICFKLLPLSWLSVTSISYAISKLGIAHGSLAAGTGGAQEKTRYQMEQL